MLGVWARPTSARWEHGLGRQRQYHEWSRDSSVAARRTRDRKVAGSSRGWSDGRIFFSRVVFMCSDSYFGICSTPLLLQQYVKDPGHSAKSAGGRLVTAKRTCAPRYIERRGTKARILSLSLPSLLFFPSQPYHPPPPHHPFLPLPPLPARPSPPHPPPTHTSPPLLHYLCGRKPYLTNFSQKSNHGQLQSRDGLTNGTSLYYIASVQQDHYFCVPLSSNSS